MTGLKNKDKDAKAIKLLIQKFFDAINAADTDALGSHFFANANLTILRQEPPLPLLPTDSRVTTDKQDIKVVMRTTIEKFIALLEDGKKRREGEPGPELHEAPDLDGTDVKIDASFASAWSPFRVTFDGVLHHYGVMVYTLGKDNEVWKIEGLTQSYRRTPGWEGSQSVL
jgi:hypothetical protein